LCMHPTGLPIFVYFTRYRIHCRLFLCHSPCGTIYRGHYILADDVQLVSTVNERRQLGSVDVRNFTRKISSERHRLPPATDDQLRRQCTRTAYRPISLRHGRDSNSHTVQVRAASKNNTCLLYCYSYRPTCVPVCLLVYTSFAVPPSLPFLVYSWV